jgi:tyrosyl-tRNA synthetase
LPQVLKLAGLTASTSESIRLIKQGAVKIDGEKIEHANIGLEKGKAVVIQVGKYRIVKLVCDYL